MKKVVLFFLCIFLAILSYANVILPAIFSDHMVLQQNSEVTIWGWAKPNEKIVIAPGWEPKQEYSIIVNNQSAWNLKIKTPRSGGPYQLTIKGYNTIVIDDVLIGEVWLGSGQSNMEWTASSGITNAEQEIAKADFPQIRFFSTGTMAASEPQQLLTGKWEVCTPQTMKYFSAVLYFFGREIHEKTKFPVGLINSSWGGTPVEIWMSASSIANDRILKENATLLKPAPWGPHEPGRAYNSMIFPLAPYYIKGALWYQGEGNTVNGQHYARALSTLIQDWRSLWGIDFSFYIAQIAPFAGYGTDNVSGAVIRDQQRKVLKMVPHTGMAVLSDIGDLKDIHPKNKVDVGRRLALWALNKEYSMKDILFSGPDYSSYKIEGDKINIFFDYAQGLMAKDGPLAELEILNNKNVWTPAVGIIKDTSVQLDIKGVSGVKGFRFGYKNDSNFNLFNGAGLPASCVEVIF